MANMVTYEPVPPKPVTSAEFAWAVRCYPKQYEDPISFGISGIRHNGEELMSCGFRVGMIAAIRSQTLNGAGVGVMVTSCHTSCYMNGFKIIDGDGLLIDEEWAKKIEEIINICDPELEAAIRRLISETNASGIAEVFLARDIRSTSRNLCRAVLDGVRLLGGEINEIGVVPTPQLHYVIKCSNEFKGDPTILGYHHKITNGFKSLIFPFTEPPNNYVPTVYLDCAHGNGTYCMRGLIPLLEDYPEIFLYNTTSRIGINQECGEYYIATERRPPFFEVVAIGEQWASLDGDCDRLIFYYTDPGEKFRTLNGDKIGALFCLYLKELLDSSNLAEHLTIQAVITVHSNYKIVEYITETLKMDITFSPPGVRNLIQRSKTHAISICFEFNGHVTIQITDEAYHLLKSSYGSDPSGSVDKLCHIADMTNSLSSDGICNFFLVQAILRAKDWNLQIWDEHFPTYPSKTSNLKIVNRHFFKTDLISSIIYKPFGLQREIVNFLQCHGQGSRAVVRPSVTTDYIRVYTEGPTQLDADLLNEAVLVEVVRFSEIARNNLGRTTPIAERVPSRPDSRENLTN